MEACEHLASRCSQAGYLEEHYAMLMCYECGSQQVSVWGEIWVDFYDGGSREIDGQQLDEFGPKYGDLGLCRECGFTWTYGHPD